MFSKIRFVKDTFALSVIVGIGLAIFYVFTKGTYTEDTLLLIIGTTSGLILTIELFFLAINNKGESFGIFKNHRSQLIVAIVWLMIKLSIDLYTMF